MLGTKRVIQNDWYFTGKQKQKINIKLKSVCMANDIINKMKR
jgi:hypothetical protein